MLGIHRGGLAGGAEAVAQVQNEQSKLQANRIAERQFEVMKLQTLIDAQNASKIGDKKLELDAYDRLAKLATDQKDRKSTRLNSSHTDISRMPSSA